MWTTRFRALTCGVLITYDDGSLSEPLARLFGTFEPLSDDASSRSETLLYRLRAACRNPSEKKELWRDENLLFQCDDMLDLLPMLELDLYRQICSRCPDAWLLHGAAVRRRGGVIGLVGPSGHGKSTLALALVARGASYLTDECFAVDSDGSLVGVTRPIGLSKEGFATPCPDEIRVQEYPVPIRDRHLQVSLVIHPPADRLIYRPDTLAFFVCLRFVAHKRSASLRRLSSGEALSRLWSSSFTTGETALAIAGAMVAQRPVYELVSGAVEPACAALERL